MLKLARLETQSSIYFLCTTIIEPDVDDYIQLARVVKYIQSAIGIPLILPIDNYVDIKWYVDASFVVPKYMRTNTGGFVTQTCR